MVAVNMTLVTVLAKDIFNWEIWGLRLEAIAFPFWLLKLHGSEGKHVPSITLVLSAEDST